MAITQIPFGPDANGVKGMISYLPRGNTLVGLIEIMAPGWDTPVFGVTFGSQEQARVMCEAFGQDPEICSYFIGAADYSSLSPEAQAKLPPTSSPTGSWPEHWTGRMPGESNPERVRAVFQAAGCVGCSKCKKSYCECNRYYGGPYQQGGYPGPYGVDRGLHYGNACGGYASCGGATSCGCGGRGCSSCGGGGCSGGGWCPR